MPFHFASALVGIHVRRGPKGLFVGGEQSNGKPPESQQGQKQETGDRLPHLAEGPCL